MRVTGAGSVQQPEIVVGQVEHLASEFSSELSSTASVVRVAAFADTLGVVEDGEQLNGLDVG